jgi:hypothetical protein
MKRLNAMKSAALALVCAGLIGGDGRVSGTNTLPASAADFRANAGNTFVLAPTSDPSVFKITADGVAQVSVLGNCVEHAEVQVQFPASPGQPILLSGSGTLTSSDGASTVKFTVTGTAKPDPANPAFFNNSYQVTFAGGSGAFASATGAGQISELVVFTSPLAGTGTWTLKGYLVSSQ